MCLINIDIPHTDKKYDEYIQYCYSNNSNYVVG